MNTHSQIDVASAMQSLGQSRLAALSAPFLEQVHPFAAMNADAQALMCRHLEHVFYSAGAEIMGPDNGPAAALILIEQGSVRRRPLNEEPETVLESGAYFPLAPLLAQQPADAIYQALEDCYGYRLSAAHFHEVLAASPELAHDCARTLASQLSEARQSLQTLSARRSGEQRTLHSPLTELGARDPLAVQPDTPLRAALEQMSNRHVGSVAVVDGERRPIGIFTRHDVLDRVVLGDPIEERTLGDVMSIKPHTLSEHATAYDAVLAMAAHGIRHILVVDADGRLTGVVSERDLVVLQRSSPWQIRQAIEAARDIAGLQRAAADVRRLARAMLGQGIGSAQMTRFVSALNDALTRRVLDINLEQHDLFDVDWCWLAFGSEGRDEQTFATDQDNGIIFVCNDFTDRDQLKLRLLEFATAVNGDLDRCGFPLCQGQIMASNPAWCLTIEEWEAQFSTWVQSPEPTALLNATIFFDFRPIHGKLDLAGRLRRHLLNLTTSTPLFLRAMAHNALDVEPPLATFRDFRTDLEPGHPGKIDLKKYGARLFVDAARIFALATGVGSTNTAQRLKQAAARLNSRADEVEAAVEAFDFIQMLRLRHQPEEGAAPHGNANLMAPDSLNELDRRILKEAFKQAKKLQLRLKLDYQTG